MADAILAGGGIYAIRNKVNGKVYVGSASKFLRRWYFHKRALQNNRHHSIKLQRAWNKHGESQFEFLVVETCADDMLIVKEQYWIEALHGFTNGYNSTRNAGNTLGMRHTREAKKKMSEAHKAMLSEPQFLKQRTERLRKIFSSPDIRAKLSNNIKNAWKRPEFRQAATQRAIDQTRDLVWRAEHSVKVKAAWADPERREKMCAAMKGRPASNRKSVTLWGVEYPSIKAAADAYGHSTDWVRVRVRREKESHERVGE